MKKVVFVIASLLLSQVFRAQISGSVEPAFEQLTNFSNVRDFALSESGNEAYFTIQSQLGEFSVLAEIQKRDSAWGEPTIMPFSGKYSDLEPFISKNGLRLYFSSNRPLTDTENKPKDFDIWYVERETKDAEWGSPINIGTPVNTSFNEFYPSLADNNNLYFTSDMNASKGKDDILYSAWKASGYAEPKILGEAINSVGHEFNAYVSPKEDYIIFTSYGRKDGFGSGDLYLSFRNQDGEWTEAVNLGEGYNSKSMDYCPFVDVRSNTLYFTSKRSSVKQVNDMNSMEELQRELNQYENGFSRIYKVFFDEKIFLK